MISIKPKWCELIASGKKTIEVRKTKPKIDVPFKCYIYCTKPKGKYDYGLCIDKGVCGTLKSVGLLAKCNYEFAEKNEMPILSGKVIGEFVCDKITMSFVGYNTDGLPSYWDIIDGSCLTPNELVCYGEWKTLYGWHISDLVIYDKPKELSEFYRYTDYDNSNKDKRPCSCCEYSAFDYTENCEICSIDYDGEHCIHLQMKRPPQSWCYVDHPTEKVCTGARCPMQVGHDVKNCKNKDCFYRTETEKGGGDA